MKLTLEQLKEITCGAARILPEDGGFRFWRFTAHQEELYSQLRPVIGKIKNYHPTSTSSSGIRFAFRTDSTKLRLQADVKRASPRTFFSFDVWVDGAFFAAMDNFGENPYPWGAPKTPYPLGVHRWEIALPAGEKLVEVYFPWSVCPVIQEVALDAGASLTPVKRSKTYLAFGDSITQGYDILRPSNHYVTGLARYLDADVINKGVGGEIFFPALGDSPDPVEPDYITIAYGTNDMTLTDCTDIEDRCRAFCCGIRKHYPSAKLFLITPVWRTTWQSDINFDTFPNVEEKLRRAVADIPGLVVLRGFDLIPQDETILSDKQTHPTDKGFAYYYENLCKKLEAYL
ncbi:MAG: hypothetical protein J6Q54_07495 [Oscillospiraceae bacterium]|nr:hypothetical protein [Oscillospiraceae bacterium]